MKQFWIELEINGKVRFIEEAESLEEAQAKCVKAFNRDVEKPRDSIGRIDFEWGECYEMVEE